MFQGQTGPYKGGATGMRIGVQSRPTTLSRLIPIFTLPTQYRVLNGTGTNAFTILDMRKKYLDPSKSIPEEGIIPDPIKYFEKWFLEAKEACTFEEANACALATATKEGRPSCRMVLLKTFSNDGFEFYTNYTSRKAGELAENPYGSIMFYWAKFNRSIRIEGKVEKLPGETSNNYWVRRPTNSQASASVSNQSKPVPSREFLEAEKASILSKYTEKGDPIPRPDFWGGYIVIPETIEFWQGQSDRLHDRIKFKRNDSMPTDENQAKEEFAKAGENGWYCQRLAP